MIVYTSKECTLQIPKGLGNFAAESADIEPLSGSVIELSATTVTLSGAVETLEGETSKNKADIAALGEQVGNLSSSTVTGLETAQNAANSANILASSAYTRADEAYNLAESLTGVTGGPNVYVLNLMTQEERANLYAEIAPYRWQEQYMAVSSGFPVQDYAFYYFAGEETSEGWNGGDRGFVPLQLTAIHPDDYGGALFFTGTAKSRQNNNEILWVRYIITSTGEVDKNVGSFTGGSGGSGGIKKVDELPAVAEEGDVVWLNGATGLTGYTVTANGDNWASWPWELDRNYFNINGRTISIRGSLRIGKWTKTNDLFSYWEEFPELIMRVRRNTTDGGPVFDFIDPTGQYTITAGSDALSITSNTFSRSGSLYVYSGGKWCRKAEREIYLSSTGSSVTDLVESIWFGIEDADYDNLVIRYAPNGKDIREFKITTSAFYGIDMQCSDDRGTVDSWGRLSVFDYRMGRDGSINDLVGEKWIVSEDQISHPSQQIIRITSTGSFPEPSEFDILSSENNMYRIYFRYNGDNEVDWAQAPLKYVWRRKESINGEEKLVYYWAVENLFINGTAYSGSWHCNEFEWGNYVTDSWSAQ